MTKRNTIKVFGMDFDLTPAGKTVRKTDKVSRRIYAELEKAFFEKHHKLRPEKYP